MSQLNPDAKEFVPVSPTRTNAVSPVPNFNRDVVDDALVARSPRRAMPMDTNVPSPEEFCRGIKQRPSELFEDLEKGIDNENNQNQNVSYVFVIFCHKHQENKTFIKLTLFMSYVITEIIVNLLRIFNKNIRICNTNNNNYYRATNYHTKKLCKTY